MLSRESVALVGAGSMGGALLRGWLDRALIDPSASAIFDPKPDAALVRLARDSGVRLNPPVEAVAARVLVLAVKPQTAPAALPAFVSLARESLVVSIMAGMSIERVTHMLGNAPRIARAMPNLPASRGRGVTGLYAPDALTTEDRTLIDDLMGAVGSTVWVSSERAVDWVTAVSGSGPAYFFLLAEALAEAGEALGLGRSDAEQLARATLEGAGALLACDGRSPADLRRAVTSPGGTTAAALAVLDGDAGAMRALIRDAVAAAARRAMELTR